MMELCEKSLVAHVRGGGEATETGATDEPRREIGPERRPDVGVPEPEALAIFASAARAVAAMHAASPVCHRDVKPENLLLGADGAWKLCDFGSASVGETSLRTPAERLAAESDFAKNTTPAYRAPEMHDAHRWPSVGPPADAFALGCLLYQLLFARLPFGQEAKIPALSGALRFPSDRKPATPGKSAASARAARADDAAGPDASDETKRLVRELLATEPSARPETATLPRRAERISAALGGRARGPRGAGSRNRKADRVSPGLRRRAPRRPRRTRRRRRPGGGGDARRVGALRGGRERGVPVPAGGDGARVDGAERTKRKSAARRYDRRRRESRRDDRRGRRRRRGGGGWARRRGRGSRGGGIIIGGGPAGPRGVGGFRPRRERRRVFFFSAAPGGRVPGSRTRGARLTGGKPFGPGPARLATSRARRALALRAADLGVGDVRPRARRRGGASARGARL